MFSLSLGQAEQLGLIIDLILEFNIGLNIGFNIGFNICSRYSHGPTFKVSSKLGL